MIPVTFGAPGETYEPTVEDALQVAVWMMMRADPVHRRKYSYDAENPDAAVRIVMDQADVDRSGRLVLPQMVVGVAIAANRFDQAIKRGDTKTVHVTVLSLEKPKTKFTDAEEASVDPVTPSETPLMVLGRIEETLMRGTLWQEGMEDNNARVIDPYRSTVYDEDTAPTPDLVGTYAPPPVELNGIAPEISRSVSLWPIPANWGGDWSKLNAATDIAVAYGVTARYRVVIPTRTNMRSGGIDA